MLTTCVNYTTTLNAREGTYEPECLMTGIEPKCSGCRYFQTLQDALEQEARCNKCSGDCTLIRCDYWRNNNPQYED